MSAVEMKDDDVDGAVAIQSPEEPNPSRRRRVWNRIRAIRIFRLPSTSVTVVVAALVAIVIPVTAWLVSREQTPVFAARAEVIAHNAGTAGNTAQFEAAVATQRVVMESRAVVEPVAEIHGLDVADLEEALTVDALTGSTVLQVTVEDEDAQLAFDVVNSVVELYIGLAPASTTDEATQLLTEELDRLTAERTAVERELQVVEEANAAIVAAAETAGINNAVPNETRARRLAAESEELLRRIGNVEERISDLAIEDLEPPANPIVSPPFILPDPVRPNPTQAAALGMFIGLALGGSLVLVRAQLAASRRDAEAALDEWDV